MEPGRMNNRHNVIAYLATLLAIVVLAIAGAAVCMWGNANSEVNLARIIGGLGFIATAIAGLTGVIGTFKATSTPTTTNNIGEAGTVNAPGKQGQTEGTGQ
jgi:hypothetical protein